MSEDIFNTMGVVGFITYYLFLMAFVTGFLLFILSLWHAQLISRDETSVERLISIESGYRYYKKGFIIANWKQFLGVKNISQFIRRILLPSTHKPEGNGISFEYHFDGKYQSELPLWESQSASNSSYKTLITWKKRRGGLVQEC
jgi:hypothetical protein